MEAILWIITQISLERRMIFYRLRKINWIFPNFRWSIVSHVASMAQSRGRENIGWAIMGNFYEMKRVIGFNSFPFAVLSSPTYQRSCAQSWLYLTMVEWSHPHAHKQTSSLVPDVSFIAVTDMISVVLGTPRVKMTLHGARSRHFLV